MDSQKAIVASVLAKLPIGSILLLEANAQDYAAKIIGTKLSVDKSKVADKVDFLLDGQQRITTLANVFSNVVQDNAGEVSNLINQQALKRRFFLKVPRWEADETIGDRIFGVRNLMFPLAQPATDIPNFLSSDILDFIEVISFMANDNRPYNPKVKPGKDLVDYCVGNDEEFYLIPLFLLTDSTNTNTNGNRIYNRILKHISDDIRETIQYYYAELTDVEKKKEFVKRFAEGTEDIDDIDALIEDEDGLGDIIQERADNWRNNLSAYLIGCLNNMPLSQVRVSEDKRDRAIDIYENMNRGGVSLSTFDLIMAKAATVAPQMNFCDRIVEEIKKDKQYDMSLLEVVPVIKSELKKYIEKNEKYNASVFSEVYNHDEALSKVYVDVFLDVLSLLCNVPDYNIENYKVDLIKRHAILKLTAKEIDVNTNAVINAIDRAFFFLNTRCGIKSINAINYNLMVVIIAVIFSKDEWFHDISVQNKMTAWYWGCIFGGEFDSDQNEAMVRNLKGLINVFNGNDSNFFTNLKSSIFERKWFSNMEFLLMDSAADNRVPKKMMRYRICQFLLSMTYPELIKNDHEQTISVFSEDVDNLEAHHIIPLGSNLQATYKDSTQTLRKDSTSILNSPLNFVYITKDDNLSISNRKLEDYITALNPEAMKTCCIPEFKIEDMKDQPREILEQRFKYISSEVKKLYSSLTM